MKQFAGGGVDDPDEQALDERGDVGSDGMADLANGFANSSYGQLRTLLDYAAVPKPRKQAQLTAMD